MSVLLVRSGTMRHQEIIQAHLKSAVIKLFKADFAQHDQQFGKRQSFLMLLAFHFLADKTERAQKMQERIDQARGPSQDQRTPRCEDPEALRQHELWLLEMLEHGKHYHVIKLPVCKRQFFLNIRVNQIPARRLRCQHLIVHAGAGGDSPGREIQKSGFHATTHVAYPRTLPNMGQGGEETLFRDKAVEARVRHLFGFVVPDVMAAADAQHAEKKRRKNNLHA